MIMKKLLLTLAILFSTATAFSTETIKVGHLNIPAHEQVFRKLIKDDNIILIGKPGAKGLIAYKALEDKDIDFLIVPTSAAVLTPLLEKDFFGFVPVEKFRFVSLVNSFDAVLLVSPKYKDMNDLIEQRKKANEQVIHAAIGEEGGLVAGAYFKSKGVEINNIRYNGNNNSLIDTLSGRTDVMFVAEAIAQEYTSKGATYVRFKDMKNPDFNHVANHVFLLTRKDMPQEKIDELMEKLRKNNLDTAEYQQASKITISLSNEKDAMRKLTQYRNRFEKLIKDTK